MNGKGGTGKTTISSLIVRQLVKDGKGPVLAIDADPNSCFAESLGIRAPSTVVGTCEEISRRMDSIPGGMTKERFIEMRVQETMTETEDFDLLVMGRPEGPGCYCYVNNLLRDVISDITNSYDHVVIDNAAGMEHVSRRTMRDMGKLVLVSDYSIAGIRSAKRIYDLAVELGIRMNGAYLVLNKVSGPISYLQSEVDKTGLTVAGEIPYRESIVDWNVSNKPVSAFTDKDIESRIALLFDNLFKGASSNKAMI